jgi:hypothetical protein
MRIPLFLLAALLAIAGAGPAQEGKPAQGAAKPASATASREKSQGTRAKRSVPLDRELDQRVKFKDYEVRTYRPPSLGEPASFKVLKDGKIAYEQMDREAQKYRVGCINPDDDGNAMIPPGKDITGQGKPNLVVSMWTGGAHCCASYSILELGDEVKQIGSINAGHSDACRFHRERDGRLDFIVSDWTFAYWHASFAESPAPDVILRYEPGGYKVAADLMRKPDPPEAEFKEMVRKGRLLKLDREGWPESDLWGTMLDLIYSGRAELAWKYCDLAWPGKPKTKEQFLIEFRKQLALSPYWPAIKNIGIR